MWDCTTSVKKGKDSTLEIVYYIFVFAKDESKAKYLIENCKRHCN